MNIWHDIPEERITASKFQAYVTITKGSNKKYEFDSETGLLKLVQVLYSAACYPFNGGIIPHTMDMNQSPMEVLIVCQEILELHTLVECSPVGVIKVGEKDSVRQKIVALPILETNNNMGFVETETVLESAYEDIRYFFNRYNGPQDEEVWTVGGIGGINAVEIVEEAIQNYGKKYGIHDNISGKKTDKFNL